ncbi:hypothetical protein RhiirA5_402674 [Rhizophagus irregularis]|uniref:DUF7431 domain-containing protein n=3 Tax=Rhizophagus irregularis TaxID=588596 RepID=A0A2I1E7Q6_9GLOM|nr:hypothetical protein GLOIN_2v1473651 [Rhizophagus irregularis DAOM 181602=DAOM 197198]EXX56051.1 hypothetical protein RirG_219690 [Rhizophagus irregularis DAOM 197198w]PKC01822.1 hypothetical protein RhiirA5_402674 [Rhizophagus irregularis]PKC62438.1 hypothetical protein RhiirA1_521912 [Rhizophagus irregularis]PKY18164.1 hypothetical protein RhiirB3_490295 [Rhizophagus irregularis]POG77637.1 hypothetical protein GLOIN_2v1473651 [Rhizophagus irregularis DAOM 181602=DAOM 197198]|eukprot:XP_025184503.1 hypothetical protein GLOIN_2v1473651 [Rhizophagus irregularis DAOM 181602=DAOM 197198]
MSFEIVFIKTIEDSQQSILKKLNLEDFLSDIRNNDDDINNSLLFTKKLSDEYAKIERKDEKIYRLKEIITVKNGQHILYLTKSPCWNIFNDNCKLDYGCTMSIDGIKKANKRAFKMKDCELTEIKAKGYKKDKLEFESKEDWMKKTNLFFSTDVNIQNFVELGLSIESSQSEDFNDEIQSVYKYTEVGKTLLTFREYLEPTEEFIKEVKNAIKSGNSEEEFKKITEEYGQFIPTEVILGGRVYFKDVKMSSKNSVAKSNEGSTSMNIGPLNLKARVNSSKSNGKSKFYSFNYMRLLGGSHPESENFDEEYWIKTLNDYQNWDCIEFKNPISIFKLVPESLCKIPYKSMGKRILYTSTEDCDYYLNEPGRYRDFELKLPRNILDIIQNKEADCDISAAVIDTEDSKNIFFSCQILKPKAEKGKLVKPRVIIHGIQKKFKSHEFKLKVKIMVVGYDTNLNFILPNIEVIKKHCYPQDQCKFSSMELSKNELITKNIPFFGIPVFEDWNYLNKSLIIGYNFRNVNNELKIDMFSYCTKENCYVNLPKFNFCTFIINHPISNAYRLLPFKFSILKKKPFVDLKNKFTPHLNPKYISSYLSKVNNYKPFFLKQKIDQIKLKYVDCNCGKTCSVCKDKTLGISRGECIVYHY